MSTQRDTQPQEFEEKVIQISRVSKKTKGGNKVGFSVLMVVGDRKGRVGVGLGKAQDVVSAIKKGIKKAKKKMITVPLDGTTIPFPIRVKKGAGRIMLKPAPKGSGVIAGGPVRAVVEAAGVRDISSKILGSSNQASSVYATFEALTMITKIVAMKGIRLKSVADSEAEEAQKMQELQKQAKATGATEQTAASSAPAKNSAPKKVVSKKAPTKKVVAKPATTAKPATSEKPAVSTEPATAAKTVKPASSKKAAPVKKSK